MRKDKLSKAKILLSQDEIPRKWYNIMADMPEPPSPPLNPKTKKPVKPEELAQIFPENLIEQEMTRERWIDIPEEILDKYLTWRPSPLHRAFNLEKYLDTTAKIYYKNEGTSPAGSHKPNTAIAQAYYNKQAGIKRLTTETGAGQWGSALSLGCSYFGLECKVYMVRISYDQKPYRRFMMNTWGAECIPSPSKETSFGRKVLKETPDTSGSLGIAIGEAIEDAVTSENTRYSLGSVLNHVMIHQSIIGLEAQKQLKKINETPDIVAGCVGGGSNFAGLAFPFINDKINGQEIEVISAESTACPTITEGPYVFDYGDTAATTPLLAMHSLGYDFVPPETHAGGLRYHGMSPIVSKLVEDGLVKSRSYDQIQAYKAGVIWARTEGFIPAPETNHVLALVIEEAKKAKEEGKEKTILINWSGHGLLDLSGYNDYLNGNLEESSMTREQIEESKEKLKNNLRP